MHKEKGILKKLEVYGPRSALAVAMLNKLSTKTNVADNIARGLSLITYKLLTLPRGLVKILLTGPHNSELGVFGSTKLIPEFGVSSIPEFRFWNPHFKS